jgi:hypothetical protein
VITGRQHSDDHLLVRASTCSDTPPASIAGRSKAYFWNPTGRQAVGGLEEADLQQRFPPLTVIPPCAAVTKAAYLAIS